MFQALNNHKLQMHLPLKVVKDKIDQKITLLYQQNLQSLQNQLAVIQFHHIPILVACNTLRLRTVLVLKTNYGWGNIKLEKK